MLPLKPPHLITRQNEGIATLFPPPSAPRCTSTAPAALPASDTCGQKVTRRSIFHGPCTVGRVIQSEFPQSACIYMKSSHSASVTSPALPPPTPNTPLPRHHHQLLPTNTHTHVYVDTQTLLRPVCVRKRRGNVRLHHSGASKSTLSNIKKLTLKCLPRSVDTSVAARRTRPPFQPD